MDDRMHPPGAPPPQQPVAPQPPLAPPAPQAAQSPNPWGRPEPPAKTPFQLDIRFDSMELSSELGSILESEAPVSKGEIYFANPPAPARPVAAAPASGSRRPKKKRKHSGAVVAGAMALILAASALLSWIGITTLRDIFAIGKVSSQEVSLTLADNLTTDEVIDLLAAKGLITQKWLCKLYSDFSFWMRSRNLSDPSEAKQPVYLGGPHKVESNMSLEELLGAFKSQPKTTETSTLVFPEGYTVRQVVAKIGKYNVATVEELERRLRSTEFDYPFLKELNTERRFNLYEGYLFPDTYEFYIRENSSSVLRRFFDNFNSKWTEEYDTRAQELGMTIDQVITLASIIQMEAANKAQMADISGVLHNRLNHIEAYPMLECDSTRDYVTNNIAINGMDRGTAEYYYQAYNTYQCTGLPTGPICNPGIDAIEAALNPKKHSYYYFQHDRNKKIYLSKTKAEHDKVTTDLVVKGLAQ